MCTYKIYEAGDGWRWNCTHQNGNILFGSSEAYSSKDNALNSISKAVEYTSLGTCKAVIDDTLLETMSTTVYIKIIPVG